MARYSDFLGRKVEVHYRAGDIILPASGTFVADSGRSIFLEQSFVQRGQQKHFRWEIPYQYIVRLEDKTGKTEEEESGDSRDVSRSPLRPEPKNQVSRPAANASSAVPGILPIPHPPKTA
jgi:hypothetical protein